MRLREAAPAAGVFVFALAWLLLLRPYGFQLEDEGTLLSWFDRVARGQRSYFDFHTGYTPGLFAFGSAVFDTFGPSATAMRGVLAVVNALSAAALTEITRRVAGAWMAPVPALLWLAFVPLFGGEFSAFNIPYPTWPATLAWMVLALAMLAWVREPRTRFLVVAGLAAAAAMWVRPNSGAFALAGATWVVAAFSARRTLLDLVAATAAAASMALGVWYTFEFRLWGMDAVVHLVPMFAISVLYGAALGGKLLVAPATGDAAASRAPDAVRALAVLAAAFLVPTLAWTVPLASELGWNRFLYEVFLVGAGYQTLYYKPHPAPEVFAVFAVASTVALAVVGRFVGSRRVSPVMVLVAFGVAGAAVKGAMLRGMLAPEGLAHSFVLQLENSSFWFAAVASFGGVAWLWRVPAGTLACSAQARALAVVAPLAVAMYAQMFPRSDFMHQVTAVPLSAVLACGLLDRAAWWWARGSWPRGMNGRLVVRGGILAAASAVLVLAFAEKAAGPLEAFARHAPEQPISERLDVRVEAAAGDELESVRHTVEFLRTNTSDGEELWSFPATSGILFAAGRVNVAPHDYWYPGRPDRAEEARVRALLEQKRPRYIVTLNRGWNFFAGAPAYFEELRRFARDGYTLAARFGRYDVLARRDVAAAPIVREAAPAGLRDVLEPNLERRRQAAWRWMESVTPDDALAGAISKAQEAGLDPGSSRAEDRRNFTLLLRALRDGGDMRGASWAFLGLESGDERIRREAADAMEALGRNLGDARARFANDFDAAAWRRYVAPWAGRARELRETPRLEAFADGVLWLSGEPVSAGRE